MNILLLLAVLSSSKTTITSQNYVDSKISGNYSLLENEIKELSSKATPLPGESSAGNIYKVDDNGENGEIMERLNVYGGGDIVYTKQYVDGVFVEEGSGDDKVLRASALVDSANTANRQKFSLWSHTHDDYLPIDNVIQEKGEATGSNTYSATAANKIFSPEGHDHDNRYVKLTNILDYRDGGDYNIKENDNIEEVKILSKDKVDNILEGYIVRSLVDRYSETEDSWRLLSKKYIENNFYKSSAGSELSSTVTSIDSRVSTLEGISHDNFFAKGNVIKLAEGEANSASDDYVYSSRAANSRFSLSGHDHGGKYATLGNVVGVNEKGEDEAPTSFGDVSIPTVDKVESMISNGHHVVTSSTITIKEVDSNRMVFLSFRLLNQDNTYADDYIFAGVLQQSPITIRDDCQLIYSTANGQTTFSISSSKYKIDESDISIIIY